MCFHIGRGWMGTGLGGRGLYQMVGRRRGEGGNWGGGCPGCGFPPTIPMSPQSAWSCWWSVPSLCMACCNGNHKDFPIVSICIKPQCSVKRSLVSFRQHQKRTQIQLINIGNVTGKNIGLGHIMWLNPDICENTVNTNLIRYFFSMLRFHDVLTHVWSHLIRQQMSSFFCPLPCGKQRPFS